MKIAVEAGKLAQALALRDKKAKPTAHLSAADGALFIASSDGNVTIKTMVPAEIFDPGQVAVSADQLAKLVNAFDGGTTIIVAACDNVVKITSGQSRYRLPIADAPAVLAVTNNIGNVSLSTADLAALFEPLPAAETEPIRFYLCGVYLHLSAERLCAVATDGVMLLQTSVAVDTRSFPDSIVPSRAIATMARLIRQTKPGHVTLRRSGTLFEAATAAFTCTTRLIDAVYPDYERILPARSANVATCSRSALGAALERLAAAATALPLVGLTWHAGEPVHIFLARQPDSGSDIINAETRGMAQIALALPALASLIDQFEGDNIRIEADGDRTIIIRAGTKFGVLTACNWHFPREAAALSV